VPNETSRSVFTAAVLLLLVAGLASWVAYSGAHLTIGEYPVPSYISWAVGGVFALVGLMAMRASHLSSVLPEATGK
jgi:hypothetical protein